MTRDDFLEMLHAYRAFLNMVEPAVLDDMEEKHGLKKSEMINELKEILFNVGPR